MFFKLPAAALASCICLSTPVSAARAAAPPGATAPDPAKLAFGQQVAEAVWPNGTFARMLKEMTGGENGVLNAMLDMRPADLLGDAAAKKGAKGGKLPAEANLTVRQAMRAQDPHFDERTRITMKVMSEEMGKLFAPLDPKMRSGLARAYANRFSADQLRGIAAFFATPAGKSFAAESMMVFTDKELMKAMVSGVPDMVEAVPKVMERVTKATAHLPRAPKAREDEKDEDGEDEDSDS